MAPVLPVFRGRIHVHHLERKTVHVGDLDVRRKRRNGQSDGIAAMQQFILHQRVEDVAHRRGAAFDGKDVEFAGGRAAIAHLPGEEFLDDAFAAAEHPAGHGIQVADDALGEFVGESFRIELEFADAPVPGIAEQFDTGCLGV